MAHQKLNLPSKICLQCQRPFEWRKKWWRCWDEVRFCSERCKREHKLEQRRPLPVDSHAGSGRVKSNACAAGQVEDEFG